LEEIRIMTPEEAQRHPLADQTRTRVSVCRLRWKTPLTWLAAGWRDFIRCPVVGLTYGVVFTALGWLLAWSLARTPEYTLMLAAGLLLIGPALAMGLMEASRRCELNLKARLNFCIRCWWPQRGSVAIFAGLLLVIELLWGRTAMVVFALFFDAGIPDSGGVLRILLDPANLAFVLAYLAVAMLFGGLVFAISVVSIPMMLDRPVDAITAALTSLRVCLEHPVAMACWAALIAGISLLAMLPLGLGWIVVLPVIGHASWHVYRGVVCPSLHQADAQTAS
jgi:uncharacterized membrane protein